MGVQEEEGVEWGSSLMKSMDDCEEGRGAWSVKKVGSELRPGLEAQDTLT